MVLLVLLFSYVFHFLSPTISHALRLSRQLGDTSLQAQAYYSLGNTSSLVRDYPAAVAYHLRHLAMARRLGDRLGEARAHWSLANAYAGLGDLDRSLRCARRYRQITIKEL
ncbi:unnamed protein product [Protopolystoma xenopodis]|uniref:Rapsyn myristoylation/linker region N-terminal domain-containing protein n=1 Tax=Protopolystoma xenopodis TaxID=117903 RepID=A0A3S5A8K9_9PLAT|nr:unnamed protein product [Protopolystoma xenopodis]